LPTTTTIVTY